MFLLQIRAAPGLQAVPGPAVAEAGTAPGHGKRDESGHSTADAAGPSTEGTDPARVHCSARCGHARREARKDARTGEERREDR